MKRYLKLLRLALSSHADDARLVGVVLAAGLLVGLFLLTQPINLRRNNILLNYFSQLQSDESRLGEAVLRLSFNLSNNYDQANALMAQMQSTVQALREGEAATGLREEPDFVQQLQLLSLRLNNKQEALERFKSANAVLKNSLLYLPHARDDLARVLPRGSVVHDQINALVEQLLLNRAKGGLLERGNLADSTAALSTSSIRLAEPTQHKMRTLISHARQIDGLERQMPSLVQQLTSPDETNSLMQSYRSHFDQRQKNAAVYRVFLLLAALALLAYALRTFFRLRDQTSDLALAASVFATASEGITITDTHGQILDVNAEFTRVTGYARAEVIGKNPRVLSSGRQDDAFYKAMWQAIKVTGQWQGEIWNRRKNGEIYPEWLSIHAATTGRDVQQEITHYVATFSDISQRKKDEAEIFLLAFYDPLTALPNRRLLTDRLRQLLASRSHGVGQAALLLIDIDHFKALNDLKGNTVGDLLLNEVAKRLLSCSREGDTVARLGSDEFVLLLHNLGSGPGQTAALAKVVGEKILKALNLPYWLMDFEHSCTCSMGISLSGASSSAEEMLQHASTAMYEAKAAGRNTLRFFDPAMQAALEARAKLEADLRLALVQHQFALHYQIQVNADGRAIGAEALIRWYHPEKGLVSPATFIPLAEEIGLILPLGQWILETACAQIQVWESQPDTRDLVLAVNVSARQLNAAEFIDQVEAVLMASGIEPLHLKLEITESMLLVDVENVIRTMRQLKAMGVSFSMDDFGTGYSSLQYLKRLPLDQVKIDQSFVRDIMASKSDQVLVGTILAMADSLNLSAIAEGVETLAQRDMLASKGCSNFQGYFFSKPLPVEAFNTLLSQNLASSLPVQH
jgi:diguanylate cyclase (GGDEF)-like protein/PAS domain S-box-containing protein